MCLNNWYHSELYDKIGRINELHSMIMDHLPLKDLRVYGKVDKTIHRDIKEYMKRLFSMERALWPFMPRELVPGFRRLQVDTGSIISGSIALQLMHRVKYYHSDLDIYATVVHARVVAAWLEGAGAKLVDGEGRIVKSDVYLDQLKAKRQALAVTLSNAPPIEDERLELEAYYVGKDITVVLNFVSYMNRKIQLIITVDDPVQTVLGFHSTTVMNFITGTHAYSLFGKATLDACCGMKTKFQALGAIDAHAKYEQRGFKLYDKFDNDIEEVKKHFAAADRIVGDSKTWIIRLAPFPVKRFSPDGTVRKIKAHTLKSDRKKKRIPFHLGYDEDKRATIFTPTSIFHPRIHLIEF